MEVLSLVSLIALGMSIVSFLKFARAKDWNSVVTQGATWAVGIFLVFLAGEADITSGIVLIKGVPPLGSINAFSKVLLGFMFLSLGSQVYNLKKAIDRSDSAAEPALLPPAKVVTADGESVDPTPPQRPKRVVK
jgi:hypothetical protein